MVCIVSFIVLGILSIFSAKYRKLAKKGWHCVSRRVTFRPCDTTFKEEIKTTILAPLALRRPKAVKPASIAIEVGAWTAVTAMIISLYIVLQGLLNLAAFGTCNRQNPEACAINSQVCGIPDENPNFWQSLTSGDVIGAFRNEGRAWGEAFQALPLRFRNWDEANYVPEFASFRDGYTPGLPIALEIIDPGCQFCAELSNNITEANLTSTHNVVYIVYPIMRDGEPNFLNSPLIARYLTAIRVFEHDTPRAADPTDWFILDQLFVGSPDFRPQQMFINVEPDPQMVVDRLHGWMAEHGMSADDIAAVSALADSQQVADLLAASRHIVENQIRTVNIPTFIANGHLSRGAMSVENLRNLGN